MSLQDELVQKFEKWHAVRRVTGDGWNVVDADGVNIGPFERSKAVAIIEAIKATYVAPDIAAADARAAAEPVTHDCTSVAWAREGLPYGHTRCVNCGKVWKETSEYVGIFDREAPDGIRRAPAEQDEPKCSGCAEQLRDTSRHRAGCLYLSTLGQTGYPVAREIEPEDAEWMDAALGPKPAVQDAGEQVGTCQHEWLDPDAWGHMTPSEGKQLKPAGGWCRLCGGFRWLGQMHTPERLEQRQPGRDDLRGPQFSVVSSPERIAQLKARIADLEAELAAQKASSDNWLGTANMQAKKIQKLEAKLAREREKARLADEMRTETPGHTVYWHLDYLEHWYERYDALTRDESSHEG